MVIQMLKGKLLGEDEQDPFLVLFFDFVFEALESDINEPLPTERDGGGSLSEPPSHWYLPLQGRLPAQRDGQDGLQLRELDRSHASLPGDVLSLPRLPGEWQGSDKLSL